ncbi:MAG: Type secretion system protein GspE [Anaerocolumna sp.]|jgi:type IV pilus assembly protein PilB|nr:Type secretion system protein GspE [Anaerocolumna sp.]
MDFGKKKKRLGDILLDAGVISTEQLDIALVEQKKRNQKLGETLIDTGITTEFEIAQALHEQLGLDYISLVGKKIDDEIIALVNDTILRKYKLIPFEFHKNNPNVLRIAMADPLDIVAIDDIAIVTGLQVEPVVATQSEIAATIDRYYGNSEAMAVAQRYSKERELIYTEIEDNQQYNEDIENSPIVLLVKTIIEQAVRQRASDIHIEPLENQIRIRYRVDGTLKETMRYDMNVLAAIIARIKIIGGMDISEKRKPQDGRFTMAVDRQEFDIRVSILPTIFGEKAVLRLTSQKALTKDKRELGLREDEMEIFNRLLLNPHGIILVTGPTGSGKSTTLYTVLSELNRDGVNIITVEDPVEANIEGINQVQVNTKTDLTFANALRSILRQDPDIIMIGEIRDSETAQIAVKASITGHLVVSTLHTNSAASTITRLVDMGIEPYLIADATVGVIAQRLIRKLCNDCKKPKLASDLEKELLNIDKHEQVTIYEPCGCQLCNDTGYYGRIGVYEIMPITASLKEAINKKESAERLQTIALKEGMKTLKISADRYVIDGITSISEMKRIAFEGV